MNNTNKKGIQNFLLTQKLFQKDKINHYKNTSTNKTTNNSSNHKYYQPKTYNYLLLNQTTNPKNNTSLTQQSTIPQQTKTQTIPSPIPKLDITHDHTYDAKQQSLTLETDRITNNKHQQYQRLSKSQIKPTKQTSANKIKRQNITKQPQIYQSNPPWHSTQNNKQQQHLNEFRKQSIKYTQKLQNILNTQINNLNLSLTNIRKSIKQSYQILSQNIKQILFNNIQKFINQWTLKQIHSFQSNQINNIAEIHQLITLLQQRLSHLNKNKQQLYHQKHWKTYASQLLTNNFENQFLELSKLCKKSIQDCQEHVQQYLHIAQQNVDRMFHSQQSSIFNQQIMTFLNHPHHKNHNQSKLTQTPEKGQLSQIKTLNKSNLLPLTHQTSPQKQKKLWEHRCESCCRPFNTEYIYQNNRQFKNWKQNEVSQFQEGIYGEEESIHKFHTFKANDKKKPKAFSEEKQIY